MSNVVPVGPAPAGDSREPHAWLHVISFGGALLAFTLSYLAEEHRCFLAAHLLRDLGIATIVGIFLALTFERLSEHRFRQQAESERRRIAANVFHYVLGFEIPADITKEIHEQILRSNFIRRDVTLVYTIEHLPTQAGPSLIRLKTTSKFTLVNLTSTTQTYQLRSFVEASPASSPEPSRFLEASITEPFESTPVRAQAEPRMKRQLDEAALARHRRIQEGHLHVEIPDLFEIPGKQAITVSISSSSVKLLDDGHVYWVFVMQTSGVDVRVMAPPDVEVAAAAYHPDRLRHGSAHNPDVHHQSHWVAQRPFLAYQGIDVSWKRKAAPVTRDAPIPRE